MPDHKLQPGGKNSRDPSPRPGMTTHPERQRDGNQEENRRRECDTVKMRDKTRHRDMETMERYYEKDRASAPRPREGEREWRARDRRPEDRNRNGKLLSNLEERVQHAEKGMKKGDTFPRMRKGDPEHDRRMMATSEMGKERGDRRERERPQRSETDKFESQRERTWQREKYRERERGDTRSRPREESKNHGGRPGEDERLRQRERRPESNVFQDQRREVVDSREFGDRDTLRKRDQLRPNTSDREVRIPSPLRRREREIYVDRRDREKAQRREGKRDTRSEGDSDEREVRREREGDKQREELIYQQSKSEGDVQGKSERDRDRDRQGDGQRYEDRSRRRGVEKQEYREGDRRTARPADREGERWRERDPRHDREEDDGHRGMRDRREREADHRRRDEVTKGRSSRSPNESSTRGSPRAQSSGEWSSDMDGDTRHRRDRDSYEERESERDGRRHTDERRDPERAAERAPRLRISSERPERDRGGEQEQRRMWLEPGMGKNGKEAFADRERHKERRREDERSVESQAEQERVKEELDKRYVNQSHYRGGTERETEEVSVDEEVLGEVGGSRNERVKECLSDSDGGTEGSWRRDAEGENLTDNMEESDREEEGGSDYGVRSESEGGSEAGWKQDRERMLSGEDGFVTVSSGGDEDYERETDEDEFKDCQEFLEGERTCEDRSAVGFRGLEGDEEEDQWTRRGEGKDDYDKEEEGEGEEGREKQPKYVFCVISQTLPRSGVERNNPSSEVHHQCSDNVQPSEDDLHLRISRENEGARTEMEEKFSGEGLEEAEIRSRPSSDLQETFTQEEMRIQVENPPAKIGSLTRDSQTDRLLQEWREKNKELDGGQTSLPSNPYPEAGSPLNYEQIQPLLDRINSGVMSPEEVEAIRIRMSGAWSMSEEPKRHSQAPHLKWAKNVVREILGHSDERIVDETNAEAQEGEAIDQSQVKNNEQEEEVARGTREDTPVFRVTPDEQRPEPEVEEDELVEVEGLRDDEDDRSKSWGEVELRNVLETINRQKRNSRFFNAAQLYQQYSEEAQNFEILRQARSDVISVCEDTTASPAPSPPPARRPLPPLPTVPHPHSLAHTGSVTSVRSLPLPEPSRSGGRPHSPRLSISLTQSASLWRDLPAVRNSTELEDLTEDQRRLQEVRFEVVTSEASYCRSLDIVVEHFVKSKQLGTLLATQDRNWLFSRLADVRAISHSFLSKLEERVESNMMHFAVCDIIAKHCQRFKMVYVPYLTNQSYQDATYQRLMNENQGFKRIVEKLERSPVCQRLPLRSFLVLPFQRITRIKLLVQNIVKRTQPGTPEATHAIKSLKLLEKLIQESNDSITQMKSIESLVSLSARVDFECRTLPLISQSRRLVREGPVTELMDFSLKDTERNIYMHLFNDYLLLSLQKEGGRFTVIDHSPVSDLRAENCRVKLHSLQKNLFRLHMTHKALLLRTDTQSDKLRWISALSRPHPEVDFSAAQDFEQMQCIRACVAQQPDELSLEKADVILVHQQSSDHWVEGTRLSDRHRGWIPKSHLETISNSRVRQRNLSDALKLTTATAAV